MSSPHVYLISGCSAGFGLSLALAALSKGHKVVATARRIDTSASYYTQITQAGGVLTPLNVTDKQQCEEAVKFAVQKYGQLDVLVNNAGYATLKPFELDEDEVIRDMYDVNVFGLMNLTRAALPSLRATSRPGRSIINISSIGGADVGLGSAAYGSTKAAVDALSDGLRLELQPFGIRVLSVLPGAFRTRFLSEQSLAARPDAGADAQTEAAKAYAAPHPVAAKLQAFAGTDGKQPGNPDIGAARIIEEIEQPTLMEVNGTQTPITRFVLGDDAVPRFETAVERLQKSVQAARERSIGTKHA